MNTRLLATTFIGEYLEVSILDELLSEYTQDDAEKIFEQIVAIISVSVLGLAFESIEDTRKRAAFLSAIPQLLSQEMTIPELSRFQEDLPTVIIEHILRSLLSLRSKVRQ